EAARQFPGAAPAVVHQQQPVAATGDDQGEIERVARTCGGRHVDRQQPFPAFVRDGKLQHSMTFTASPPRLVSLYLSCMSRPVSRMVLITLSSDTLCLPSPRSAMR